MTTHRPTAARTAARARAIHRIGLVQVRAASRLALAGRDRSAPAMATSDLDLSLVGRTLKGRLYVPNEVGSPSPLLLFFHGGGFVLGDIESHDAMCRRIAAAGAFRILSVDYRLAPQHRFPAQMDDARDLADWAFAHADELGADPARIALGGDSAGGYLSLATALQQPGRFAGLLLIYPLLQLEDDVWSQNVLKDGRFVGRLAVRYIRAQLKAAASGVPSLLRTARADLPPMVIVTGGALDPVRPDAVHYAAELKAAGARCDCIEHARQPHGFFNLTHVSKVARDAAADAGRRLGEILATP